MDVSLKSLLTVNHVGDLFVSLGYGRCREETDSGWIVARWKGLSVITALHRDPTTHARRLAQSLADSPGRFLVAVLAPAQILAIAAPRIGKRGSTAVLNIDLVSPAAGLTDFLEKLRPPADTSGLRLALRLDELLGVEPAGKQFYAAFRLQHHGMMGKLPAHLSDPDRHLLALLPLIRVLFLYFVQAKGWLNHDRSYLRTRLDQALHNGTDFHQDVLNPLFFQTLNRPVAERETSGEFSNIPYLNGGLFNPHPLEETIGAHFTNDQWRDAFDLVFERFRFCVREGDEVDAIAPDMLGHVFERLMAADDRHTSGSFYTPEPIVRQIVTVAVNSTLARLARIETHELEDVASLSGAGRKRLVDALQKIRILDPAAGTGAFLMGVLDHLTVLHQDLADAGTRTALQSRKHVLNHCLHGVDINPIAVRLAELRLWLAVIADDPTTEISEVEPLPNFDGVVMQGDTLMDPLAANQAMGGHPSHLPGKLIAHVAEDRRSLFSLSGSAYRRKLKNVRRLEQNITSILLERAAQTTERKLADLKAAAADRDLFGKARGLTANQKEAKRRLVHQQKALSRWSASDKTAAISFFSFDIHLADIMQRGGFDVVVGNPPWVRAERLPPSARTALKNRFQWWGNSAVASGYRHLPDIAVAFLERALELCRPGGVVGFLVPSKVLSADYASVARRSLVKETTIDYLHRVPAEQANLFAATTYPLALVMRKTPPAPDHQVKLNLTGTESIPQNRLDPDGPWVLVGDQMSEALKELRQTGARLGTVAPPALGLKTGANPVFLVTARVESDGMFLVQAGQHHFRIDARWIRPVLRGRDVTPFSAASAGYILWPCDESGRAVSRLPSSLQEYFQKHETQLKNRSDLRNEPIWSVFRREPATGKHRVVWADIARRPRAVSLEHTNDQAVPLNSCYVSNPASADQALVIAAMLNTSWAAALVSVTADEARGGYRRLNSRVMAQIPIPVEKNTALNDLITLSRQAHHGDLPDQTTLDEIAADALSLTPKTRNTLFEFWRPSG